MYVLCGKTNLNKKSVRNISKSVACAGDEWKCNVVLHLHILLQSNSGVETNLQTACIYIV